MKKFFISIIRSLKFLLQTYVFIPLCISILILLIYILICYIRNKSLSLKNKNELIRLIGIFISSFYFSAILHVTVFSRIGSFDVDSLSKVYEGWLIKEGKYLYDFNPIYNIIMFLPLCTIISLLKKLFTEKNMINSKNIIINSVITSFALSLLIENIQLIFSIGTFQFSDLFYNTLGGFLGALIFLLIKNKKASQKK